MFSIDSLKDLLITIQCIQKELKGPDAEKAKAAQGAYHELLDGFYEEYQDKMAPQQYKAAKDDPDYFLVLIQLAYHDRIRKMLRGMGNNQDHISTGRYSHKYRRLYGNELSNQVQSSHEGNRKGVIPI